MKNTKLFAQETSIYSIEKSKKKVFFEGFILLPWVLNFCDCLYEDESSLNN
jgi:hypothetical protein